MNSPNLTSSRTVPRSRPSLGTGTPWRILTAWPGTRCSTEPSLRLSDPLKEQENSTCVTSLLPTLATSNSTSISGCSPDPRKKPVGRGEVMATPEDPIVFSVRKVQVMPHGPPLSFDPSTLKSRRFVPFRILRTRGPFSGETILWLWISLPSANGTKSQRTSLS